MMRKYSFKQLVATALVLGVLVTSIFPSSAYAEEVGEQITETSETVYGDLSEYAPQIEQYIKEAIEAQGGDISDETLYEEVKADIIAKIESGEISLDKAEEETEETDAESEDNKKDSETEESKENEESGSEEDVKEDEIEDVVTAPSKALLLIADTVPDDTFGAVAVEQLSGMVRLTYESEDLSQKALEQFTTAGLTVEYDTPVEMIDDTATVVSEVDHSQVAVEQIDTVEELLTEEVTVESKQVRHIKVAIIDTGCDLNAINGRIAEGTDLSITDANGHGTLMAEIVASQTTENVKLLPIKAFDDNGYSTVGQVYDAIMRAIDLEADVINLSMSGAGTSQMLTNAINKATEKGIIVVVSAGNDASDVEGFMPGNIDTAITVSATDRNEVFAEYSNFGEKIDYSAVGEIIKDQGTEDTSDDLYYSGTSIASAFVSGYAACVLDNNHNADVVGTFDKYAKDLGEAGKDPYYGKGFLSLENIAFDVEKEETPGEKDTDEKGSDNKETADKQDEEQRLAVSALANQLSGCLQYEMNYRAEPYVYVGGVDQQFVMYDTYYTNLAGTTSKTYSSLGHTKESFFRAKMAESGKKYNFFLQTNITINYTVRVAGKKAVNGNGHMIKSNLTDWTSWDWDGDNYTQHDIFRVNAGAELRLFNTQLKGEAGSKTIKTTSAHDGFTKGQVCSKAPNGVYVVGTLSMIDCLIDHCGNAVEVASSGLANIYGGQFKNNKANGIFNQNTCNAYGVLIQYSAQYKIHTDTDTYDDTPYPDDATGNGIANQGNLTTGYWTNNNRRTKLAYNGNTGLDLLDKSNLVKIADTDIYNNATEEANPGISVPFQTVTNKANEWTFTNVTSHDNPNGSGMHTHDEGRKITFTNCNFYNNAKGGLANDGSNVFYNSGLIYGNGSQGISSNGSLTVNGGHIFSNAKNGIYISGGVATIIDAILGTYTLDGGASWVENAGNGGSGIYNQDATTNIYGGVIFHNKNGVYCKSGTVNFAQDPNYYRTTWISNDKDGIHASSGSVVVSSGANVYTRYNGNNGVYVGSSASFEQYTGNFFDNGNKGNGIASTGALTVHGGQYFGNGGDGILVYGNTANIYNGWFGTYTLDGCASWEVAGNGGSGIHTFGGATSNIYGGVYFYNALDGIASQGGTTNLLAMENYAIYTSANTGNGISATDGGSVLVAAGVALDSHANGQNSIYVGPNSYATINSGAYYSNGANGVYNDGGTATLNGGAIYNNPYGIHNSGTTTLSGGDVYNNTTYGVYNAGTFTMSGGKVRDNDSNGTASGGTKRDGIYNEGGTTNISGGTISGNNSGFYNIGIGKVTGGIISGNTTGISNNTFNGVSGTTTVNGSAVSITENTRGIQNTAKENGVTVNNANMKGNTYDVSQSGKNFTINGNNTKANVIELGVKDGVPEVVTINGALTEEKTVNFAQNYKNDSYNTANISVGRPMFKCINMTKAQKQAMIDPENGKLKLQSGQQTLMGNGTKRDAIMRPYSGHNMNESLVGGNVAEKDKYIVLSTKYAGIYKVKEVIDGVKFDIPDAADIFWNEDNHIKMPELWATIGGVLKKFDIIGWLKDGLGDAVPVGSIMSFLFGESNKDHDIVAQMGTVNLYINGNGQSEGENYVIEEFNCVTDTLPRNTFKKEFLDDYYYIELEEQKRHETKYSYQGWSLSDESTYLSEGVMQPQDKLDYADVLTYMDEHKDSITYGDNGLPNIPLYAVWDKYPELQAKDVGIVTGWIDESSGFAKTDAELQEIIFEKVLGTDDEDGTLTNGVEEKGVICTDFDKEEIKQFKHTGTATLTFRATDGVGNVTERKVRLYINSSDPIEPYDLEHPELGGAYPNRARCINRKYYDAGKVSVGLEPTDAHYLDGYRAGGLIPTDRWYTDPEYVAVIEEAFDNLENDTPEFVWNFTHEQVLETQAYIEEHGFGDSEEEGALRRYFDKYKGSFEKLK